MRGVLRLLRVLELGLIRANQGAVILMMMAMAAMVFANVVSRYVFGQSLNWSEEIARYLMFWVTYLGAGLAMRNGQHVAIEFGQALLPRKLQPWIRGIVGLSILAFLVILTFVGIQFSEFAWRQRSPVMQWRMGAVYLAIPIGALLFALHFVSMARAWVLAPPGFEEPDEAAREDEAKGSEGADLEGAV